ncbi:hypothetical protein HAX54_040022 [Datura stramonium]|uniref:Apyrase n=1 Tax=Datura stramonium TaxID=4076 RepID=A0ABS8RN75_DATST|nr:hypothetical protein [Datura stramonium]
MLEVRGVEFVFCFDENLDLVPIGNELELFVQKKPGLSAYASDPVAAADSLLSLLKDAENVVPHNLRSLRQLEGDASDRILQAVRDFLKSKSSFKAKADAVTVLDGNQEGAYQWVTINYLLGKLGKKYSDTVGVVDLGGGSVQMAYAISESDAQKAPKVSDGEDHTFRKSRAEILKVTDESGNPLHLGETIMGHTSMAEQFTQHQQCLKAGIINPSLAVAKVRPADYESAAKRACGTGLEGAKSEFPHVDTDNLPYLCMDHHLSDLKLSKKSLVKKVEYKNSLVEAAWPLGSAIEVASSLTVDNVLEQKDCHLGAKVQAG